MVDKRLLFVVDVVHSHLNVVVLPLLVPLPAMAGVEVHLRFGENDYLS